MLFLLGVLFHINIKANDNTLRNSRNKNRKNENKFFHYTLIDYIFARVFMLKQQKKVTNQ